MLEGFYSRATELLVLLHLKRILAYKLQTALFPTTEVVPNSTCALDKVLMDCGMLGAKTPK